MIKCTDPKAQYLAHRIEIDEAIRRVVESGHYILGEEVSAFETEFASYIGAKHCIGVGSGTEALHVALRAAGVRPGDEVITTAHTAVATISAIELAGAKPVFADIEREYMTLDVAAVERAISRRTRAIVPVHLYGQGADVDALAALAMKHGLRLIEDCAQAHGALLNGRRLGSIGDVGCFSAYPTKNLGALGDAGMIVTSDDEVATRCRLIREYGWAERFVSQISGFNTRLDELQAAVLRVKLRYLDDDNAKRRAIAGRYDAALASAPIELPRTRPSGTHVYHGYVIRSEHREALFSCLSEQGINTQIRYPVPVHRQEAYARLMRSGEQLPETERAAREVLSLPIYPELGADEVEAVISAVLKCA